MDRLKLGKKGEELARQFLLKQGLKLVARNFSTALGELDLVFKDKEELVFVEVKTRTSAVFGEAAEAVNARKQEKLQKMAETFLLKHRLKEQAVRFDVVTVCLDKAGKGKVDWLKGVI